MAELGHVAELLARARNTPALTRKPVRLAQWWLLFVIAVVGFVTGIMGFVAALQQPQSQSIALALIAIVAMIISTHIIRIWRVPKVPPWRVRWHITLDDTAMPRLIAAAQPSVWRVRLGRVVRVLDFVAWVCMAMALIAAAIIVFVFAVMGFLDGLKDGIDAFDITLAVGFVGPLMSIHSGISRWQARSDGARQRMRSFTETVRNSLGAHNNVYALIRESTNGLLRGGASSIVSTSVFAVATTAVLTATVSGVSLAFIHEVPRSVVATGRVIPIPLVVARLAGPEGIAVGLRGDIIIACSDDMRADTGAVDDACRVAIAQVDPACAAWDGQELPEACAARIAEVVGENAAIVHKKPRTPPDGRKPTPLTTLLPTPLNQIAIASPSVTSVPSLEPSMTASETASETATHTRTATPSWTRSPIPSDTATETAADTLTSTSTETVMPTPTETETLTLTASQVRPPRRTATVGFTPTVTNMWTPTPEETPTP